MKLPGKSRQESEPTRAEVGESWTVSKGWHSGARRGAAAACGAGNGRGESRLHGHAEEQEVRSHLLAASGL